MRKTGLLQLKNQLGELFQYGPIYEIQFDGFDAPIATVDWNSVFQFIRQAQPNILIWAGPEIAKTGAIPDVQWIGTETGQASRSTSSLDTRSCGKANVLANFGGNVVVLGDLGTTLIAPVPAADVPHSLVGTWKTSVVFPTQEVFDISEVRVRADAIETVHTSGTHRAYLVPTNRPRPRSRPS